MVGIGDRGFRCCRGEITAAIASWEILEFAEGAAGILGHAYVTQPPRYQIVRENEARVARLDTRTGHRPMRRQFAALLRRLTNAKPFISHCDFSGGRAAPRIEHLGRWGGRSLLSGMDSISDRLRDTRLQAEIDESNAQWSLIYAVEFGLQYYIAGRYGLLTHFSPTCGNQLHHAMEFFLKACLARTDTWQQILEYGYRQSYGHDLELLWAEFRRRNPDRTLAEHDEVIAGLNKFEEIRYPTDLVAKGGLLSISPGEVAPHERTRGSLTPEERHFHLELPKVDRLATTLIKASHYNPVLVSQWLTQHPRAAEYYWLENTAPVVPKPAAGTPATQGPIEILV